MMLADLAPVPDLDFFADEKMRLIAIAVCGGALLLCLGAMVFLVLRIFRKRPTEQPTRREELAIDVAALRVTPPPKDGPQLEFYGTPVRLAVIVLAPVGRGGEIPAPADLANTIENLIPGLQEIVAQHEPLVEIWPNQLSSH
jgi:hypothetical protein